MEQLDNTVFIGKKSTMDYVFSVQTQSLKFNEINIRGRGFMISKAVDVSQIAVNNFLTGWEIDEVIVGSDDIPLELQQENKTKISYINILIIK